MEHNTSLYFPVGQTVNMGIGVMGGYALIKNGLICRTRPGFGTPIRTVAISVALIMEYKKAYITAIMSMEYLLII